MFERFTDRARRVVVLAQEEARLANHNYIGTEHLLLGLIREGDGVAARALASLGIDLREARRRVHQAIGQGTEAPTSHIPFTPVAKKVLELSLREALQLGHDYIGTEHILLGLVREGEGVAAQVLQQLGADMNRVRQSVIDELAKSGIGTPAEREPAARRGPPEESLGPPEPLAEFPICSLCSAPLAGTLAVRTLDVVAEDEARGVTIAYCGRCGAALGIIG